MKSHNYHRSITSHHFSNMHAGLDQNGVLVGAGIWYMKNPV